MPAPQSIANGKPRKLPCCRADVDVFFVVLAHNLWCVIVETAFHESVVANCGAGIVSANKNAVANCGAGILPAHWNSRGMIRPSTESERSDVGVPNATMRRFAPAFAIFAIFAFPLRWCDVFVFDVMVSSGLRGCDGAGEVGICRSTARIAMAQTKRDGCNSSVNSVPLW